MNGLVPVFATKQRFNGMVRLSCCIICYPRCLLSPPRTRRQKHELRNFHLQYQYQSCNRDDEYVPSHLVPVAQRLAAARRSSCAPRLFRGVSYHSKAFLQQLERPTFTCTSEPAGIEGDRAPSMVDSDNVLTNKEENS